MMKKITLLCSAIALLVGAVACDKLGVSGSIKMDTVEATTKVAEALKSKIDWNEWKVYNVRWMEGEELENDLLMFSVAMINKNNDCYTQSFHLTGTIAGHATDLSQARGIGIDKLTFDQVKGITPEMINAQAIQQQYAAAKATIPQEYDFKSITSYTFSEVIPTFNPAIDRDKELGKIEAEFCVAVTERGKEMVSSAGKSTLQYYTIDFNVLPDGSVEMDK